MLNILYISHESNSVLGSSRSLLNMIRSLKGRINAVVVVPSKGIAYKFFQENKVKVYAVHYPLDITDKHGLSRIFTFLPRLFRDISAYRKGIKRICALACENNIDIVHSNSSTVDIGYYVARRLKKPHIWHLREFQDLDFHFHPVYGWPYLRKRIHNSSATISITKAIQKHFKLENCENCYQLFNAVRSEKDVCYNADKEKYFLLCGKLSRAKGCDFAIRTFTEFNVKHKDYRLKLVGSIDDGYKKELQTLAQTLNVNHLIDFEGYQTDTKKYYYNASAFLMCSPNEAMGRVTVEAMFYGCPVIGYNGGGTKEIIQNGVDGFLYNSIEECASAMEKVINEDTDCIVCRAHTKAINIFSEEKYGDKVYAIYKSVLQK